MRVGPWALLASTICLAPCTLLFRVGDGEDDASIGDADAGDRQEDASVGDAAAGLDAATADPWCTTVYGAAREFFLCAEDAERCTFYTDFEDNQSCDEACVARGGLCLGAIEEYGDLVCLPEPGENITCATVDSDLTCTCSRP